MTSAADLKAVVIGLAGFAAAEEQMLLATTPAAEQGSPQRWAALPLVAHNTEFKQQQVQRLRAVASGQVPPDFAEVDHGSAEVYAGYATQPAAGVAAASHQITGELIGALAAVGAQDLLDPARNPWLKGRQLWLQVIVRGFWHPAGHLAEYYLAHGRPERAVALAEQAAATAAYLGAPAPARGMAAYNLACARARAGQNEQAAAALREAVTLNPAVRANAGRDPDLATLRESGLADAALAP
jgi:tetratricopeptide (TPR) repeat protein